MLSSLSADAHDISARITEILSGTLRYCLCLLLRFRASRNTWEMFFVFFVLFAVQMQFPSIDYLLKSYLLTQRCSPPPTQTKGV